MDEKNLNTFEPDKNTDNEEFRTATAPRKLVPQLLYTMSGCDGVIIFNRNKNTIIYTANEVSQSLLEVYISNHLLLEGNVYFGERDNDN